MSTKEVVRLTKKEGTINNSKAYQTYARLCKEKELCDSQVSDAVDNKVSRALLCQWKYSRHNIKLDKLLILADFFNEPITSFIE